MTYKIVNGMIYCPEILLKIDPNTILLLLQNPSDLHTIVVLNIKSTIKEYRKCRKNFGLFTEKLVYRMVCLFDRPPIDVDII